MAKIPLTTKAPPSSVVVPNQQPILPFCGLAIVGEAPGEQEVSQRRPFVGPSGHLLTQFLASYGIDRNACYLGNVCQVRPYNNDISTLARAGDEIQAGLGQLYLDLESLNPKVILALGGTALWALTGRDGIQTCRGSLFDWRNRQVIATFHPAAALREWSLVPYMQFDFARVATSLTSKQPLRPPERTLLIDQEYESLKFRLSNILRLECPVAFDIEGGVGTWSCFSFATSAHHAFVVDWTRPWTDNQHRELFRLTACILENPRIGKILQNSLYDRFVLAYSYGILIRGVCDDTMLKHWELYPELKKGLGTQASIYTLEPFYKDEGKQKMDWGKFLTYCAKDSAVTYEINETLDEKLQTYNPDSAPAVHYQFNMRLLQPMMYMMLRGIAYDQKAANQKLERLDLECEALRLTVNILAGQELNVESPKQMVEFLYKTRGYKVYNNPATQRPTANEEAILKLAESNPSDRALNTILDLRSRNSVRSMLACKTDRDGRIRCSYNLVGTETGRLTCYGSNTGSGYNLQTSPDHLRTLLVADQDCELGQCDLAGADAWTVAARAASLGDRTMLDDLLAGIKVAKVIALLFRHGAAITKLSREDLRKACDTIDKNDSIYFGSKCVQHGSNYLMGPPRMSDLIFKQSGGKVSISTADCKKLQAAYFLRYPGVQLWHSWLRQMLRTTSIITDAFGHSRRFYGRHDDHDTLKQAAAHEPQANTTGATNLAMLQLWRDPDNRRADGSLIVEPLHSIHDALLLQWRIVDRAFALSKIPLWFDNEITIAGVTLTIPFEGGYGPSWGECDTKTRPILPLSST